MNILSKKEAIENIKTRSIGNEYTIFEAYLGIDPVTKKPIRMSAKSKKVLEKKIEAHFKMVASGGATAVLLSPYESFDAKNAIDILKSNNIKISLTDCVNKLLEYMRKDEECPTRAIKLGEAFAAYYETQKGKSEFHQKAVRNRVGKWVELFGADRMLSEITAQEVSKELEGRLINTNDEKTKTTYNNHLNYIKSFLNWCTYPEQGYIKANPIASMKLKTKEWHDPEYLSSADTKALFTVLEAHKDEYPEDLAYAILSFFCGMRQEEIKRVREGDNAVRISLEYRNIRVIKCKGASKGIKPRSFTIPDTALAWMQSFDFMTAIKMKNETFRKRLVKRAEEAGIKKLPENAGRHSFITMHAAAYHDPNLLSSIAGNSEDVRSEHYDGLTFENEGKAYFEILPS